MLNDAESVSDPQSSSGRVIVYLRFPFERNGFVDPENVYWDSRKTRSLWEYLSRVKSSKNEIDSERFQVSTSFILQQAAWLYEQELQQVQAQIRRVSRSKRSESFSNSPHQRYPQEISPSPGRQSLKSNVSRGGTPQVQSPRQTSHPDFGGDYRGSSFSRTNISKQIHKDRRIENESSDKSIHIDGLYDNGIHSRQILESESLSSSSNNSFGVPTAKQSITGRRLLSVSRNLGSLGNDLSTVHDLDATFLTRDKKLDIQANPYDIPGNRSMISKGSSFTDLSEASISQSALEDAMHDLSTSSSTRYESND